MDGFQSADALAVELLITEGLVITGARADAEPTIARESGEFNEPFWVLDIGDKEMRPRRAFRDAGGGAQAVLDLGKLATGLTHEATGTGIDRRGLDLIAHRAATPAPATDRGAIALARRPGRVWNRRWCRRGRGPNVGRGI